MYQLIPNVTEIHCCTFRFVQGTEIDESRLSNCSAYKPQSCQPDRSEGLQDDHERRICKVLKGSDGDTFAFPMSEGTVANVNYSYYCCVA
jgi:hypothetical protein